jgi:hypothetical protein
VTRTRVANGRSWPGRSPSKALALSIGCYSQKVTVGQQTLSEPLEEVSKLPESISYRERYDTYITSKKWERRRVAYYAKYAKVCRACKTKEKIHLHHHTYVRMGNEHDDDLVPLCEQCHDLVHQLHRSASGVSLTAATRKLIVDSGGIFRPRRKRMTKAQRKKNLKNQAGVAPYGFITPAQAAEILGVSVEVLPRPKQRKQRRKGFFNEATVRQWATTHPPRWLREARAPLFPVVENPFPTGATVRFVKKPHPHFPLEVGCEGVVIERPYQKVWHVQVGDLIIPATTDNMKVQITPEVNLTPVGGS